MTGGDGTDGASAIMPESRLRWADYAKGLTIILVVYGHAVVGVAEDVPIDGTLHLWLLYPPRQFRMPAFFFIAGVFAAISVRRDWPTFLDRTVAHLVWVFVVWNVLQYAGRTIFAAYANTPIEPWDILLFLLIPINVTWFIWALLLFYLALRLARDLPPALLAAATALLAATPLPLEHEALARAAPVLVYFVLGWALSDLVRKRAGSLSGTTAALLLVVLVVSTAWSIGSRVHDLPIVRFVQALIGIAWVLAFSGWLARRGRCRWLGWIGERSLPIFVMHTLVTAATREILLRAGIATQPAVLILLAWAAGVGLPLLAAEAARRTGLGWLLERPAWLRRLTAVAADGERAARTGRGCPVEASTPFGAWTAAPAWHRTASDRPGGSSDAAAV